MSLKTALQFVMAHNSPFENTTLHSTLLVLRWSMLTSTFLQTPSQKEFMSHSTPIPIGHLAADMSAFDF